MIHTSGLAVALLSGLAVLVWPGLQQSVDLIRPVSTRAGRRRGAVPDIGAPAAAARQAAFAARDGAPARISAGAGPPNSARGRWRRTGRRGQTLGALDAAAVLALVESVTPALEAGLSPAAALSIDSPRRHGPDAAAELAMEVASAARMGAPLGPVWRTAAARERSPELDLLGAAWTLSESSGAPLADAVKTTAAALRSVIAQERRVKGAVAGARATTNLLSVLPVGGPLLAAVLGVGLGDLYSTSAVTELCLGAGVVLALAGRWWVRRLVASVARGPVLW